MRRTVAASTVILGGLVKHPAKVEDDMAYRWMHGCPLPPPWDAAPDEDWVWRSAAGETPEQVFARGARPWRGPRRSTSRRWPRGGLNRLATGVSNKAGEHPNLRYVLVTLIEEYARRVGHADGQPGAIAMAVGHQPGVAPRVLSR